MTDPVVLPYMRMVAYFDDGRDPLEVCADQRDQYTATQPVSAGGAGMRLVMATDGSEADAGPGIGFMRGVAWAYLRRTGAYTAPFRDFNAACSFVVDLVEPATLPAPDMDGARPTQPATAG